MKKTALFLLVPLLSLAVLTGCKGIDYEKHLSDVRSDLFAAETEDFSLTLSCITRETPYAADGVACNTLKLIEIAVKPSESTDGSKSYRIELSGEPAISGELSYRTVKEDYFLSQGVSAFPEGSVTVRLSDDGETTEITATSVKTEKTLSPEEALGCGTGARRPHDGGRHVRGRIHGAPHAAQPQLLLRGHHGEEGERRPPPRRRDGRSLSAQGAVAPSAFAPV